MNTWIRIVLISALTLILLEPAVIATDIREENTTHERGLHDALHRADLPPDGMARAGLVPARSGDMTRNSITPATTIQAIVSGPSANGVSIFPLDHIWNTPIDSLPTDSRSADYIYAIGSSAYIHADFGSGLYEGTPIGIPYNIVNGSQQKKTVTFEYTDESDSGPYPIPDNPFIEGGSDHHLIIIDQEARILYELYAAEKQADGSWTAGSGAIFNLSGYMLRPSGWTSADAAGLAILPGLVRYDEVNTGNINHALRFTAPTTRREYVWPARHFASSITDPAYPPMGQRFRLKSSFNTSGYPYQAQIVLNALKKYGMILSDNGSPWYITGAPDEQWNNDALHTLHQLKGSDFEAVDSSSLMINQDSGQALLRPIVSDLSSRIALFNNGIWYVDYNGDGVFTTGIDKIYGFGGTGYIPIIGDWNGTNSTKIGVYQNGQWILDYNGDGAFTTGVDKIYGFGGTGYIPVVGDWNGDHRTEIGIYQNGAWYLDYNGDGIFTTRVDKGYGFGGVGFTPLIGDWNGDGRANIGVYQNGAWYLDYDGDGVFTGGVDKIYGFGGPGFTPLVGDWNGDNRTEIGIYQNGAWYLDYNGDGVFTGGEDKGYGFGGVGFTPLVGDWNGTNSTKIGVYQNGLWILDDNGDGVFTSGVDKMFGFGGPGFTSLVGNWN